MDQNTEHADDFKSQAGQTSSSWNPGVKAQIRAGLGRPRLGGKQQPPTAPTSATATPSVQNKQKLQSKTTDLFKPLIRDRPANDTAAAEAYSTNDEEGEIRSTFSGDDEAVVINLAEQQQQKVDPGVESGEISEEEASVHHGDGESEEGEIDEDGEEGEASSARSDLSMSEGRSPSLSDRSGSIVSAGSYSPAPAAAPTNGWQHVHVLDDPNEADMATDPLMIYSSGQPIPGSQAAAGRTSDLHVDGTVESTLAKPSDMLTDASTSLATGAAGNQDATDGSLLTLADISLSDLQHQLRYYHIGRPPSSISLTTLVRCPLCAGKGHLTEACPHSPCSECGQRRTWPSPLCNVHPTPTPPESLENCPLCNCTGHKWRSCESRWRTSAWPYPNGSLPGYVNLFCYECGKLGHLGNDCSRRRPGKVMGSSAWSVKTGPGAHIPACDSLDDVDGSGDAPLTVAGAGGVAAGVKRKRLAVERRDRGGRTGGPSGDGGDADGNGEGNLLPIGGRLPQPTRSGSIKIAVVGPPGNTGSGAGAGQISGPEPGSGPGPGPAAGPPSSSNSTSRGKKPSRYGSGNGNKKGNSGRGGGGGGGGGGGDSKSKPRSGRGGGGGGDAGRGGGRGGQGGGGGGGSGGSYRPMPSAAKRAYIHGRR